MARILDGKWLSQKIKNSIKNEVQTQLAKGKRAPCLAVILVGDNPASKVYVSNKSKFAKECLFRTLDVHLPADCSQSEIADEIAELNKNSEVDGILLQLPLPKGLKSEPLLSLIDPGKDADGLHPLNQGLLMRNEGILRPCTPSGAMLMIDLAYAHDLSNDCMLEDIKPCSLAGKKAVVVGRSVLVGKPIALMLMERNATVTIAHSRTENLAEVCCQADVLVAAVGKENLIRSSWIKPGAVVIDVGINRLPDGKLCGDVAYHEAVKVASAITPVPGGVGPMTVAMLIKNTLSSYLQRV